VNNNLPKKVRVRDVTLRDGLQSLPQVVSTESKLRLYDALVNAGVRDLQVTSFVNPARLPQLADAENLWALVSDRPERQSALIGNMRGFERAVAAGVKEVEFVISLSATYNAKNVRRTIAESRNEAIEMSHRTQDVDCSVSIALANCYHCAFEGYIEQPNVLTMIDELHRNGIHEIAICDTTGYATPDRVYNLMAKARTDFPDVTFGVHLHDTRGRGLANAVAALHAGIEWFDAAVGNLGGSPFAPGMGGNLSLETLADTLSEMNISTGINVQRIWEVGNFARDLLNDNCCDSKTVI
jgi:hydroxymethylglutaryl-CoA lyase